MTAKVLLTGFEPFGGHEANPSYEVARSLDGMEIGGCQVVSRILPVEWGTVKTQLEQAIDEIDPVIVLSLGLSAGRTEISVEKVAINYAGKIKDNAGVTPEERHIVQGGNDAYFATIPVEEIVDELNKSGIPARISLSAGSYLCNYAFYVASRKVREDGRKSMVGFIHVPASSEMVAAVGKGGASMPLSMIAAAIVKILEAATRSLTNCG